jgi:hypothetical protein
MAATVEQKPKIGILKSIQSFNGIDVVTIGVLAILFRVVGMGVYRLTAAVFPFDMGLRFGIDAFLATLAVLLVRKKGSLFAYAVVWWLINFVVEGEDLVWLIGMWFPIILAEWYLCTRPVYGGTLKNVIIGAGLCYGFFFTVVYWIYLLTFYQMVYSVPAIAAALAISLVGSVLGAYLGFLLGRRIKPLLE